MIRRVAMLLSCLSFAATAQTFSVTRTSYDTLYADDAHADPHLCGYAAYRITPSAPVADVWATIGSFAGGRVSLAPTEDGVVHVGAVAPADYGMAYFYLCGDTVPAIGEIVTGQSHVVSLWDRDPSLPGAQLLSTTAWSLDFAHAHINATANKIDAVTVSTASPVLGGTFTIRVDGRTGTVGSNEDLVFTAAAHADWPAGAYELIASYIDLPDVPGDPHIVVDALTHTGLAVNSANTPYFAIYTFRVNGVVATPAETSPYGYIDSGNNLKHVNVSHVVYPPIPPGSNPATLAKTADPDLVTQGTPATITFALIVNDNSDQPITLDQFRDVLPAGFSYVPGSSTFAGAAIPDPFVTERDGANPLPEQDLAWLGAFPVPALGSRTLAFQATVPADIAVGAYDNCSVAFVDGTQVDTTASTLDNAPACARVTVLAAPPPGGALVVQKSAIGGGAIFAFTGTAPLGSFDIDATAGSGATSFTTLAAGSYTVTETVPAGWTVTNIACSTTTAGSTPTTFAYTGAAGGTDAFEPGDVSAVVTLGTDAQVNCTFTDTRAGSLVVAKATDPAGTGQSFAYATTGTGLANFALAPPATPSQSFANLAAGSYTIAETVPSGWTLTGIACSITTAGSNTTSFAYTGAPGGTAAFEAGDTTIALALGPGDEVACGFANAQNGSITIAKQAIGGDGAFPFDTDGNPGTVETTVTTTGGAGTAVAFASVPPGTYALAEIVPAGWTLDGIACTGTGGSQFQYLGSSATGATPGAFQPGDTVARIELAAGDAVTCTFVDDRQAQLTIRKSLQPVDNARVFDLFATVGTAAATRVADDVTHDGAGVLNVPANATVVASETDAAGNPLSGYSTTWICTGTAAGTITGTGTQTSPFVAPPGGDVECIFTNTVAQQVGNVTIVKQAIGGDGTFAFDTDGNAATSEVSVTTLGGTGSETAFSGVPAGGYSIGEAQSADWTLANLACTGAGSTFSYVGATTPGAVPAAFDPGDDTVLVTLGAGSQVTCTFTNVRAIAAVPVPALTPLVLAALAVLIGVLGARATPRRAAPRVRPRR